MLEAQKDRRSSCDILNFHGRIYGDFNRLKCDAL
jgi:hypothetical protein